MLSSGSHQDGSGARFPSSDAAAAAAYRGAAAGRYRRDGQFRTARIDIVYNIYLRRFNERVCRKREKKKKPTTPTTVNYGRSCENTR